MIFDFLKRKEHPKTFSALGTDIHCHLLPGVDDGSSNFDETISCLKVLASLGFNKVHFTPHFQAHYPNEEEDIKNRFADLHKKIKELNDNTLPEIGVISGEYRFDPLFARMPGTDNVLTLPGKILLCEFSLHFNDYMPLDIFQKYIDLGYTLILAHPERYPYLGIHSAEVEKMKSMGIFFQVNILSLNGFYGDSARSKGFEYIESGLSEYLGTDTHNMRYANALIQTAENKQVQALLKKHTFLNSKL